MKVDLFAGAKTELLDLIKQSGELSVDDATAKLGLTKTTVRQHLLLLEKRRLVERAYRRIGQGRPKLVFRITANGERLYPSQDGVLLRELLKSLMESGNEQLVADFFEKFWEGRLKEFEKRLSEGGGKKAPDRRARLKVLREVLEREGLMPRIEQRSKDHLVIRECNCPFTEAVKVTKIPCRLEAQFIKSAIGAAPTRVSYMPNEEATCAYEFGKKSRQNKPS